MRLPQEKVGQDSEKSFNSYKKGENILAFGRKDLYNEAVEEEMYKIPLQTLTNFLKLGKNLNIF